MVSNCVIVWDISYVYFVVIKGGWVFICVFENIMGWLCLIRCVKGYEDEVVNGCDFWQVMVECYGLSFEVLGGFLDNIFKEGLFLLIVNYLYGILDGLMMGYILLEVCGDFCILVYQVFCKVEDFNCIILLISFDEIKEVMKLNLQICKEVVNYLS